MVRSWSHVNHLLICVPRFAQSVRNPRQFCQRICIVSYSALQDCSGYLEGWEVYVRWAGLSYGYEQHRHTASVAWISFTQEGGVCRSSLISFWEQTFDVGRKFWCPSSLFYHHPLSSGSSVLSTVHIVPPFLTGEQKSDSPAAKLVEHLKRRWSSYGVVFLNAFKSSHSFCILMALCVYFVLA